MRLIHCFLLFGLLWMSAACNDLTPAPAALEDMLPWMYGNWETASDAELAGRFAELSAAATPVTVGNPQRGKLVKLKPEHIAPYNLSPRDVNKADGLYLFNAFHCTLGQLEKILISKQQMDLFPDGGYEGYEKIYTTSLDDYLARKTPVLHWESNLTASKVVATLQETLQGGVRLVPDQGKAKTPWGAALVAWTLMPNPAKLDDPDYFWRQDYQVEMYYERTPGEIVHAYGMWREVYVTTFLDSTTDGFVERVSDALVDWDEQTAANCAAGKP